MRYLVFYGWNFYPDGGWNDYLCQCNTPEEGLQKLADSKREYDWYQIVDLTTMEVYKSTHRPFKKPIK